MSFIVGASKGGDPCAVVCGPNPCGGENPCLEDGTSVDGLPHYNADGVLLCGPGYEDCAGSDWTVEITLDNLGNVTWYAESLPATIGAWYGPITSDVIVTGPGDYSLDRTSSRRSTLMGYTFDPPTPQYSITWEIQVETKLVVTPISGDPYEILIPQIAINNITTNGVEVGCIGVQLPGAGETVKTYIRIISVTPPTDTPPPGYGPGVGVTVGMEWKFTASGPMTFLPP